MIGSVRGTVVERTTSGEVLVEVGGVGYRVNVPLRVVPDARSGRQRVPVHAPARARRRDDALRLPEPRRARHVRGADRRDRCRPEARARDPVGAHAEHAAPRPRRRRSRRADARARRRQAHRAAPARRAEGAARGPRSRPRRGDRAARRRRAARCATRSSASATRPTRCARCSASSATTARSRTSCATRSGCWPARDERADAPMREELLSPTADPAEAAEETTLRPRRLDEFVGQPRLREHLEIMLTASRRRGQAVDHVLFAGPPGLGKTTLAGIIATEMGARMQPTSGPALERAGDLAAILTNLDDGGVLFIDEIHGLPRAVEEVLYPAMEDFQLDIVIGKGPSARTIRLDLPRFTLVGATTRTGLITGPLRDRFGFVARLDYYDVDELTTILVPGRADPRRRARARRRERDRVAEPGHAADRQPAVEAGARLRRGARRRAGHARHRARRARAVRGRRARPRQGRPGDPRRAVPHVRGPRRRPRDARGRGRRGAGDRRGRLRAVPAPVRPARAHAPRAGWRPPAAFVHLGLHDPPAPGEAPNLF